MAYKVYFKPSSKVNGAQEGCAEFVFAMNALKAIEALLMSDEQVKIMSSSEGEINVDLLRTLARKETATNRSEHEH